MKKRIQILMSTYNGADHIERQIKSIMNQKNVDVFLLVRDDGSTDKTLSILQRLQCEYAGKIKCFPESNIGWKKSFMRLLFLTGEYDYYGFSDQDDVWMDDKVISCITLMESDEKTGIKLAHCNPISVDVNFKLREEQEKRVPYPPYHKAAIATEYFQGCGMIWNAMAMEIIKQYSPQNDNISHDYWVGLICYFFGNIYFCNEEKFYHIRYGNNSSEDGNVKLGRMKRIKKLIKDDDAYMNPAMDLLDGYGKMLNEEDFIFLKDIRNYKKSLKSKLTILLSRKFRRPSIASTILFKFSILLNRY